MYQAEIDNYFDQSIEILMLVDNFQYESGYIEMSNDLKTCFCYRIRPIHCNNIFGFGIFNFGVELVYFIPNCQVKKILFK